MIEPRPVRRGGHTTPEERDTLLSRVYVVDPGIVFYREIPVQTVESVDLMLEALDQLGCQWPTFIEVATSRRLTRPALPRRKGSPSASG